MEQGHLRAEIPDDASVALVGRGNEQVHHGDIAIGPEPSRDEIRRLQIMQELGYDINAINRSGNSIHFDTCSVGERSGIQAPGGRGFGQRLNGHEAGGRSAGAEVAIQRPESVGWNAGMVQSVGEGQEMEEADLELGPQQRQSGFDLGVGAGSGFESPHSPQTPITIISSNIHPAYRSTFDNASRPPSRDGYCTPEQASSPLGVRLQFL
jgi:hypothetical protein